MMKDVVKGADDNMRVDECIKMLCVKSHFSMAELARRLNKSPQSFCQKAKRCSFTVEELSDIALVSDCDFKCEFIFSNGERIIVK